MTNQKTEKTTTVPIKKLLRTVMVLLPLGAAISIGIHFWKSEQSILSVLTDMKIAPILIACLLATCPWGFRTAKLYVWTRFLGKTISIRNLFRIVLGTDLGRAVSPTVLGGGPVKVGLLMKNGLQSSRALTLSLWSSCEDIAYFLLGGGAGLLLVPTDAFQGIVRFIHQEGVKSSVLVAVPSLVLMAAVTYRYRKSIDGVLENLSLYTTVKHHLQSFLRTTRRFLVLVRRSGKRKLVLSFFLTSCQWTCYYLVLYFVLSSLGIQVHPVTVVALQVLLYIGMLLVPTPGAAAGAEALFLIMFGSLIPDSDTGVVTAGWRALTFYFQICTGLGLFVLIGMCTTTSSSSA